MDRECSPSLLMGAVSIFKAIFMGGKSGFHLYMSFFRDMEELCRSNRDRSDGEYSPSIEYLGG